MADQANGNTPVLLELTPRNLLSFGPDTAPLPLERLNVLIGPNGSGKSNLFDALALIRSSPNPNTTSGSNGYRTVIGSGGGIEEWVWKGQPDGIASVAVLVARPDGQPLRHYVGLRRHQQSFLIDDERVENERPAKGRTKPYLFYEYRRGQPIINEVGTGGPKDGRKRKLTPESVEPDTSILAQRRDLDRYPELTYLATFYDRVRLYREWAFGRTTVFRSPQRADLRTDRLEENFSNLGLVLHRMCGQPKVKARLLQRLRDLYDGITDVGVHIDGGTVQVYFWEGDYQIPATRLSDGSLRYLSLLVILCDPNPPPLVGIEEPELGLHPDLLPRLADLLVEASDRTQLIVTTHSEILIDALTERPEAVVVCERGEGRTTLRRLDRDPLKEWLADYRLGQLWSQGQIGGNRW